MLDMKQAMELLRDGEHRQWLIADWSWHTRDGDNGGVYIGLIRPEAVDRCLTDASWNVHKGDGLVGFTTWREDGVDQAEYGYAPVSSDSWPLVLHRDFHGLAERQLDVIEEFRHFHNLWHDRQSDTYFRIRDDTTRERAIFRDDSGPLLVDTALLRKFCGARNLCIILQVDSVQFFDKPVEEVRREIHEKDLVASIYRTNNAGFASREAFGRLLGKRVLRPLPREQCGVWPFEDAKAYEDFVIGASEDGSDVVFTCDPEQLANYFGKNPENPHYLTPVYFRREVLRKYAANTAIYSLSDGYLTCGGLWGLRLDNDHEEHVVVFLGDLGGTLPETEQKYWRSFNTQPVGGISDTLFKRAFQGQFTDPKQPELRLGLAREHLVEAWEKACGFALFSPFHEDERNLLSDIRSPLTDDWGDLDRCLIAAAKSFIDYLNEKDLGARASEEVSRMRIEHPKRPIRGIDKLEAFLRVSGAGEEIMPLVDQLRRIQRLRSLSAAHRKNSDLDKLLTEQGFQDASPRVICRELVLEPLLAFCQVVADFAEKLMQDRKGEKH